METYHDYVIKNGNFIGKFNEMYEKFDNPWMQNTQPNKYSRMAGMLHMKNFQVGSVLECGCGLGYYADWIHRETNIIPKSVDISEVAVKKAKELFPHLDFEVADITKNIEKFKKYDCVLFAEIVWYILNDFDNVLKALKENFSGKFLIVNQVFYKGTQSYGNNYFTNLEEFIAYMPFDLLGKCEATTISESTIETSTIFRI